jgi:tetratricopeptide (TPR) repeat protein/mono/diheme cytochrome c family protein
MRSHELNCALAAIAIVAVGAACSRTTEPTEQAAARAVTFNADIAPVLFDNCASCHRPIDDPAPGRRPVRRSPEGEGGSAPREGGPKLSAAAGPDDPLCIAGAPFSVLDYGSVRRYARAISSAVQRRAMPPWLPESGHGEFAGERRLGDDQIALIAKWVESGAPEGNPADVPQPPTFSGGWQLGTPDLVLTLPEAFVLQPQPVDSAPFDSAQGKQGRPGTRDVFRNFVIPVPITTTRYVRAVEFRADRPQALHHADVAIDVGRVSRALDRAEPGPGFAEMDGAQVYNVYGWSPGKVPVMEPSDNAWTLEPGTDLILLLHMIAGAQSDTVQPSIGLFFSDTPPTRTPISVKLEAHGIAIPAGEPNYVVEDSYVLPVDVEAVSIYPHAHYLGKEMRGTATLPDGSQKDLLWIRQWDFRWQDRYRYRSPVVLPRGTRLSMRFTYDNSAANRNNRNNPPQRVRSGPRSTDEMGHLWIEVVPRRAEDAAVLTADFVRRSMEAAIASAELDVRLDPKAAAAHNVLATRYLQARRVADARAQLEEALRLDPRNAEAHSNLGTVLQAQGLLNEGMQHLRTAAQLKPKSDSVRFNLGAGLLAVGQPDAAIREFQTAIVLNPENADAHFNLGVILGPRNQLDAAIAHLQRAVEINPLNADAHHNLAVAYGLQRRIDDATASAQAAVRLKPDFAPAREMLQRLLAARNR